MADKIPVWPSHARQDSLKEGAFGERRDLTTGG